MVGIDNWIVFLLLIFPSIKMYAIAQFPVLDDIFDIFGIISCAILIIMCLFYRNRLTVPKGCKYIFGFMLIFLLSTTLHFNDNLIGNISEMSKIVILILYLILVNSQGERSLLQALIKLRKVYLIVLFIDSICMMVETLGFKVYTNNIFSILGMDNYAAFSILPMLSVVFYTSYRIKGKIQAIDKAAFFFAAFSKIITFSFTAILAMSVMIIVIYLCLKNEQLRKIISPKFIVCIVIALIVSVVYFNMDKRIDALLVGTGKGISNRTAIWKHTLQSIPKSPIIGFGSSTGEQFKQITGFRLEWSTTETHPHNYILSILFYTGALGLLCYIGIFSQLIKAIRSIIQIQISAIALGGLIGFLILSIPDGYTTLPPIYVFFTVIFLDNVYLLKRYMISESSK